MIIRKRRCMRIGKFNIYLSRGEVEIIQREQDITLSTRVSYEHVGLGTFKNPMLEVILLDPACKWLHDEYIDLDEVNGTTNP